MICLTLKAKNDNCTPSKLEISFYKTKFSWIKFVRIPVPVAARYKAFVCGRLLAGNVGSNPTGFMDVYLLCVVR